MLLPLMTVECAVFFRIVIWGNVPVRSISSFLSIRLAAIYLLNPCMMTTMLSYEAASEEWQRQNHRGKVLPRQCYFCACGHPFTIIARA
jgi:hypothetical protein